MTEQKKFLSLTYGCQMNEHDSEVLAGILATLGYEPAEGPEQADLIILNTCSVREKAENKVYGQLGKLARLKSKKPELVLAVCGCMVQRPGAADEMRKRAPYVDLLFGVHNLYRLPELLGEIEKKRSPATSLVEIWEKSPGVREHLPIKRVPGVRAYVTITYGCNNYCTYCIVPYVRGREHSRLPQDIRYEVKELASSGYPEVILLGQNVNSYGRDLRELEPRPNFASLLSDLNAISGLRRIRYATSHPRDFSRELVAEIGRLGKVCEHFHLPVQSGSNAVLKRMRRGYTREKYLELATAIRELVPEAAITTDIIVGFPGEKEDDFVNTLRLLDVVRFDSAFTFKFSPRTGTPAASMPDQVPPEVISHRFAELLKLQNQISLEKNKLLVGRTLPILVEGKSNKDEDLWSGRTRTNKVVIFPSPAPGPGKPPEENLAGREVPVLINRTQTWNLFGEMQL